ncbi:hypothetical protein NQD34_005719 [Periophthalmus magnuspinnatus]|nr:hypothetical protein NQD34_005719 [Periophthalmus magnuspinnatus]
MRHSLPSLREMTAFLENMRVWFLFFGRAILAMMVPIIKDSMMQPTMHCTTTVITATGHSSVTQRQP